jgi:hypothetical protein
VAKAEILRLIYQGRFLHSNVTLGALGLPFGKTTVMHLVPRENLPEPNSQGGLAPKESRAHLAVPSSLLTDTRPLTLSNFRSLSLSPSHSLFQESYRPASTCTCSPRTPSDLPEKLLLLLLLRRLAPLPFSFPVLSRQTKCIGEINRLFAHPEPLASLVPRIVDPLSRER